MAVKMRTLTGGCVCCLQARASDMVTHMFFTCGTRRSARAMAQYVPTYLYQFSHKLDFLGGLTYDILGDYHR